MLSKEVCRKQGSALVRKKHVNKAQRVFRSFDVCCVDTGCLLARQRCAQQLFLAYGVSLQAAFSLVSAAPNSFRFIVTGIDASLAQEARGRPSVLDLSAGPSHKWLFKVSEITHATTRVTRITRGHRQSALRSAGPCAHT